MSSPITVLGPAHMAKRQKWQEINQQAIVQAQLNTAQTLNTFPQQHPLLERRIQNQYLSFRESLELSVVE